MQRRGAAAIMLGRPAAHIPLEEAAVVEEVQRDRIEFWTEEVLRREPRHFGALSGLGLILQDLGDDKQALEVYRRTLDIYPRIQRVPDLVKTLKEKVEGRDI